MVFLLLVVLISTATSDPVAEYLERTSKSRIIVPFQKRSTSQRQTEAACSQPGGDKVTCSDSSSPHRCHSSPGDDTDSVLGEPAAKKHKPHDTDHRTEDVVRDHMTRDTTKEELKKKVTCGKWQTFYSNKARYLKTWSFIPMRYHNN